MPQSKKTKKHSDTEQTTEQATEQVTEQNTESTSEPIINAAEEAPSHESAFEAQNPNYEGDETPELKKIQIEFPYSELIRSKIPQPFDIAEAVATDWVNDGSFEKLPIEQPVVQYFAGQGLKKAKDVEKQVFQKLEQTGVLPIVQSQVEVFKRKFLKK